MSKETRSWAAAKRLFVRLGFLIVTVMIAGLALRLIASVD
jgi:hypothetical protein